MWVSAKLSCCREVLAANALPTVAMGLAAKFSSCRARRVASPCTCRIWLSANHNTCSKAAANVLCQHQPHAALGWHDMRQCDRQMFIAARSIQSSGGSLVEDCSLAPHAAVPCHGHSPDMVQGLETTGQSTLHCAFAASIAPGALMSCALRHQQCCDGLIDADLQLSQTFQPLDL